MKAKFCFLFLLLLSFNVFAGQDGNGTDGQPTEEEKLVCELLVGPLLGSQVDDFGISLSIKGRNHYLTKNDIRSRCCKFQPYAPACKKK